MSITIPIIIAERLFRPIAADAWLSNRAYRHIRQLLAAASVFGLALFGFVAFREQGYTASIGGLLIALAIAIGLVRLALRTPRARPTDPRSAPRRWTLRGFALGCTFAAFLVGWGAPSLIPVADVAFLLLCGLFAFVARTIAGWSRRTGWGQDHRLALATGVLGFFAALAPLLESRGSANGKIFVGQTAVVLVTLVWLGLLARRRTAPAVALTVS